MRYLYLGDRQTREEVRGVECDPVLRADGKCVISTRFASALVEFENGTRYVEARRRLRLLSKLDASNVE